MAGDEYGRRSREDARGRADNPVIVWAASRTPNGIKLLVSSPGAQATSSTGSWMVRHHRYSTGGHRKTLRVVAAADVILGLGSRISGTPRMHGHDPRRDDIASAYEAGCETYLITGDLH